MKTRTDLRLGDVSVYQLFIIYLILDFNGYDFYFRCKPPIVINMQTRELLAGETKSSFV